MIVSEEYNVTSQDRRVHDLLLAYLRAGRCSALAGVRQRDRGRCSASYPQAAAAGLVPDLPSLLERHPELADALRHFFALGVPLAETSSESGS